MRMRYGASHGDLPEKRVHQGRGEFAENGLAKKFQQEEGLKIREDGRRKQGYAADSLGKLVAKSATRSWSVVTPS